MLKQLKSKFWIIVLISFLVSCVRTVSLHSIDELPVAVRQNKVIEVQPALLKETLKKLEGKTVIVEFWTTWCVICQHIKKPLRDLAEQNGGQAVILTVDVTDDDMKTLVQHEMRPAYPGFLIIAPDLKAPLRKYGSDALHELQKWLPAGKDRPNTVPLSFAKSQATVPPKAVLIAGSSANANFAQEVIWMRKLLLLKGLKAEEIACFYALPDPLAYFFDQAQFDELAADLGHCEKSNRVEILRAVQKGINANPERFVLYATSHGSPPRPTPKLEKGEKDCFPRAPSLVLDGGDNDCEALDTLTPDSIATVIPKDNQTQKIMIFQGCYTGGFISSQNNPVKSPSDLARLSNVKLFTASRTDRPSFGCDAGTNATVYGTAFGKNFEKAPADLDTLDWKAIYSEVNAEVRQKEKNMRIKDGSEPQFFER